MQYGKDNGNKYPTCVEWFVDCKNSEQSRLEQGGTCSAWGDCDAWVGCTVVGVR